MAATTRLAHVLLPNINLAVHEGAHPRVGALDVLPFVLLEGSEAELIDSCRHWAERFSAEFEIPVHLYEKAALSGREFRLPYLRGQMGSIQAPIELNRPVHPNWGTTIIGVRDFLLATNINVNGSDLDRVKEVAKQIRVLRDGGEVRLAGVRALGFELKSRGISQLSLNFTQPDSTTFDTVYEICRTYLQAKGLRILETELIGVIRTRDAETATHLKFDPSQLVG